MTGTARGPLLFLDVDGPLIPFGAASQQYPTYQIGAGSPGANSNPLLARINPEHGPRLMALPAELVWATTWMADANECISPRIGLPQLAVVTWPEPSAADEADDRAGRHWKTRALVDWAAGRAFAWVDDEITDTDRAWASAHHPGQALLHRVDSRQGLTNADYAALNEWLCATPITPAPDAPDPIEEPDHPGHAEDQPPADFSRLPTVTNQTVESLKDSFKISSVKQECSWMQLVA